MAPLVPSPCHRSFKLTKPLPDSPKHVQLFILDEQTQRCCTICAPSDAQTGHLIKLAFQKAKWRQIGPNARLVCQGKVLNDKARPLQGKSQQSGETLRLIEVQGLLGGVEAKGIDKREDDEVGKEGDAEASRESQKSQEEEEESPILDELKQLVGDSEACSVYRACKKAVKEFTKKIKPAQDNKAERNQFKEPEIEAFLGKKYYGYALLYKYTEENKQKSVSCLHSSNLCS